MFELVEVSYARVPDYVRYRDTYPRLLGEHGDDPYDGSGNGPTDPEPYRRKYPKVEIVKGLVSRETPFPGKAAVISTSVVEHIDTRYHEDTVAGIHASLPRGGYSIPRAKLSC